jgi:HSP20 family protein
MEKLDIKILNPDDNILHIHSPQTDISEKGDYYFVRVNLPGAKKEDINIKIEEQTLIIEGLKKKPVYGDDKIFHMIEREFGAFRRKIRFKERIDYKNITANLKDGVLTVKLKKLRINIKIDIT